MNPLANYIFFLLRTRVLIWLRLIVYFPCSCGSGGETIGWNKRTRPRDVIMYSCTLLYPTIEYRVLRGSGCNIYKGLIIIIHLRAAAAEQRDEVVQTLLLSGRENFESGVGRNLSGSLVFSLWFPIFALRHHHFRFCVDNGKRDRPDSLRYSHADSRLLSLDPFWGWRPAGPLVERKSWAHRSPVY